MNIEHTELPREASGERNDFLVIVFTPFALCYHLVYMLGVEGTNMGNGVSHKTHS